MTLQRTTGLAPFSPKRLAALAEQGIERPFTTFSPDPRRWEETNRKRAPRRTGVAKPANEFPSNVVQAALEREQWGCARCGRGIDAGRGMFWSGQHRRARTGLMLPDTNSAANCLILCGSATSPHCHYEVERRLEVERIRGYWIRQFTDGKPTDPTTVPVLHAAHGWVLLDNDGGYERCDEPEGATA